MRYLINFLAILFVTSCISNKKVTLLQKDDLHKDDIKTYQAVRTYFDSDMNFELSEGDIIKIDIKSLTDEEFNFFKEKEGNAVNNQIALLGQVIDKSGNIKYPVIGNIHMAGLTILEAEEFIEELAAKYVANPVVNIRLLNFRVTFLGELNAPGTYTTINDRMSFTEALGYAGGFSEFADINNVKLIRQINNQQEIIYINPLEEYFVSSPYYYLHPNDLVIVPPLKQRPFRKYFAPNLSLFISSVSILLLIINLN
jgi:polysaccharide export outer membrane protein